MVSRGEVWWSDRPDAPRRPVVVLTRDPVAGRMEKVLAAEITTRSRGLPTEVELDTSDGMPRESVASLDNVSTVTVSTLTERITRLGPERMHQICRALAIATGG